MKDNVSNILPWDERVTMLQVNPLAATVKDITRMAEELCETWEHFKTCPYAEEFRRKNESR